MLGDGDRTFLCKGCRKCEINHAGLCSSCRSDREQNPRNYCNCGRSKYSDALCCSVCWDSQ